MARTFEAKPAVRERVPLLVGIVGPSGSGKTWSALRLATGIQRVSGGKVHVIDSEARRALHYSDHFKFQHVDFQAPFGSLDYLEALKFCVADGAGVVVVDSASHEHDGPGGMVDFQEKELDRMAGQDHGKRERMNQLAWSKPKLARRKLISGLLQMNCNFIFCFRAKSVSKPVKVNGKTEIVPQGFTPIAGPEFVFEMTTNVLLLPKSNGVPTWDSEFPGEAMAIKLPAQFQQILTPGRQLSEDIGQQLAEWAAGETPADLAAAYKAAATRAAFDALEERRKAVWARAGKDAKAALKAASDDAARRLAGSSSSPGPPASPPAAAGDPAVDPDDPANDHLFARDATRLPD